MTAEGAGRLSESEREQRFEEYRKKLGPRRKPVHIFWSGRDWGKCIYCGMPKNHPNHSGFSGWG
jgi:hypothetical protein